MEREAKHRATSIRTRLLVLMLPFVVVILCLTGFTWGALGIMSAVRAYVAGEGLYSKAEKDAVNQLYQYTLSRQAVDYQRFLALLEVPRADARARRELEKPDADLKVAEQAFIHGLNDERDVAAMVFMFRRFRRISYIDRAVALWAQGDLLIERLADSATLLHTTISAGQADATVIRTSLDEINRINQKLRVLQDEFSATLGEAARWLTDLLWVVSAVVSTLLLAISAGVALVLAGRISRDLRCLRASADQIAQGDYRHRIELENGDEITQVAKSFNRMTERLVGEIDEHSRTVNAYREQANDLSEAQAFARLGSWQWNLKSNRISYSQEFGRIYRFPEGQFSVDSNEVWGRMHPDDAPMARAAILTPEKQPREFAFESRIVWPTGETRVLFQRGRPVLNAANEVVSMMGAVQDITERKELEARLVLSDRMASLGTLAGGVAHEINNPLAYVTANLDFVAQTLPKAADGLDGKKLEDLREAVKDALHGASRVRGIVRDLKTFSRPKEDTVSLVNLQEVLESCLKMCSMETRHRARVVSDYAEVPDVLANDARLGQVFINLLVNAAHAIREGNVAKNEIRVITRRQGTKQVVVEISDTGVGIPPDKLKRIFDPFYTTKPVGVGTGLGLSICHGILVSMGGQIEVESTLGVGTTFRVLLPVAPTEVVEVAPEQPIKVLVSPRRARLLIVDDERFVGLSVRRLLADEYEVEVLDNGKEALHRILSGERFDLILCDLMMPEMTGMELYQAVQNQAPEVLPRMVFITGGAFTEESEGFLERRVVQRITKPFDPAELRRLISHVIAPTSEASLSA